jgi:predicted unusual protein kinase regulating ubiquinone biosynthesis (AarF/ABC1/UbiB family)
MGAKIVASAIFLDFGIVDAITDKHREYPANYVIPIKRVN